MGSDKKLLFETLVKGCDSDFEGAAALQAEVVESSSKKLGIIFEVRDWPAKSPFKTTNGDRSKCSIP